MQDILAITIEFDASENMETARQAGAGKSGRCKERSAAPTLTQEPQISQDRCIADILS